MILQVNHRLTFLVCLTIPCLVESLSLRGFTDHGRCFHSQQFLGTHHYHNLRQHTASFRTLPRIRRQLALASSLDDAVRAEANEQLLDSLRSMRVREIKTELESLNVSTRNALEKEELVQRLFNARIGMMNSVGDENVDVSQKKKKKKKRRRYDDNDDGGELVDTVAVQEQAQNTDIDGAQQQGDYNYNANTVKSVPNKGSWTITTPFIYHELETSKSVAAQNAKDVYIRPSPGKYAAIKVQLKKEGRQSGAPTVEWTLLVDTACSGLVLSPSAVARANQQCPGILQTINNAGTMTMAGSSQGAAVAKWDTYTKMVVGGVEIDNHANVAACQDIGALPAGLDGILGLSFLDQFACVDFDFVNDELRLDSKDPNPLIPNMIDVVAQGPLSFTKLRIYTADVTLDGRGPVKLLVDTGAAGSFLNWKGVSDMKLSSSSPQIEPIREQIGAMGADNMALQLTHRFAVKRRWNLVAENTAVGDFCPGIGLESNDQRDVDISDLPVLESLKGDGVGGILGADLLMMCDVVRFSGLNGASPSMILMKQ